MRVNSTIDFDDKIVYLHILNDSKIGVADGAKNFSIVDLESAKKDHSFLFKSAYVHIEKETVSFSGDGKYLAYSEKDQSVVRVIDIHSQKLHHSFPTLNNQIETLCFDPSSNYLVAGSITGRVFLWNLFATGQVSRLSSFPEYTPSFTKPKTNYVSYACFSPSGELVATTGYGGSIVVTNIHTEVSPKRITPNHVRINAMCFIGEDFLAAGNIEGGIDILDLKSSQIQKHFQTKLGKVNGLAVSSSGSFLFASGHSKDISLIDLKKLKILDSEYISLSSKVTRIDITRDDRLLVGCENGHINIYQLSPIDLLQHMLNTNSFLQAFELIKDYPLLTESKLCLELEEIWTESLDEAIYKVERQDIAEANEILRKFSKIPSKKSTIKDFQDLVSNFERFKAAVAHENFSLAYNLAEYIPLLKKTTPYIDMEKIWDESFLKAQAFVVTEKTHHLFKVLEPFSKVSSKLCFIQVLLHQPHLFLEFVHLINTHDYTKIFEIAHQYPCLKEIQSYQKIILETNDLYDKALKHIDSGDYNLAQLEIEELSRIPYMKTQVRELSHIYSLAVRFEKLYKDNDLISCYTIIDKNKELKNIMSVKSLENEWSKKMREAEREALLGHTKEIINILGPLLTLESRSQKVGTLLRLSFMTQIKLLIIKHQYHTVQSAINNYIKMFSYDTELHNLIKKLKKDKIMDIELSPEQEHRRARSLWLITTRGRIPENILDGGKDAAI